ncbi:MAG: type VI secretion system contractile sheath small subunit [Myxococcales bacterium]|nr:type VI secretion system contractile sheath small subunit [Myxococcales bacterium]
MAKKEGSVAPKERVNIVYKSYTGDAVEEIELPMRFLVIGDFTGRDEETPIEQRDPINVDKDNFNQVLEAQKVSVDIAVPNKLSGQDGDELSVHLDIKNMRDFTPDAVCEQVPELKKLVELRDALTSLKGPLGNMPAFRKRLQALVDDPEAQQRIMQELSQQDKGE